MEDFRALGVEDSIVEFEAIDDLRKLSGVCEVCEASLRIISQCCTSSVMTSLICPFAISTEYSERLRAGRAMIVLCCSFLKLVPVIELGCSRCSALAS